MDINMIEEMKREKKGTSFTAQILTFETDIIFVVKVPVLSLQITVVHPKVSTDGKDRTIAFNLAIRFVPRAKHLQIRFKHLII